MTNKRENFCGQTRREMLWQVGNGFAGLALSSLLARDGFKPSTACASEAFTNPLRAKEPHFLPKAKHVIFLYMYGGPSHVDTFDPKPTLTKMDGQPLPGSFGQGLITSRIDFRKALMRGSPWNFTKAGKSGLEISDLYPNVQQHADKIAVVRSCYGDAFDHAPAIYLRTSGSQFPGRPSLGLGRFMV